MSVKAALLPDRSVLEVSGEDRKHFLQGLVTNDVERLTEGEGIFAALLTPQGKILFDFFLLPLGESFLLDCPPAVGADLTKRLSLYRLRAKVAIADASDRWRVGAAWGDGAEGWAKANAVVAYPDPRLEVGRMSEGQHPSPPPSAPGRGSSAAAVAASSPHPERDEQGEGRFATGGMGLRLLFREASHPAFTAAAEDYDAHRIALAVPEGGKDYAYGEAFPHDACFDLLHGVSFTKGCYVGQEVVSRMQHRGTARTRVLAVSAKEALPQGGADILSDGHTVGRLGSVAGSRGVALARVDRVRDALSKGRAFTAADVLVGLSAPSWAAYTLHAEPDGAAP